MDWRLIVLAIIPITAYILWVKYSNSLTLDSLKARKINAIFGFIVVLFSAGFLLRLNANKQLIDIGYYLTDFSFLLSYLIIGTAALLGQAKYNS